MTASIPSRSIAQLARYLVDAEVVGSPELGGEERRVLAWTLKDLCYAAWSTEPKQAVRAAEVLRGLCPAAGAPAQHGDGLPTGEPQHAAEVEALGRWTAGIAHITRGEMAAAIDSFDSAARLFAAIGQPQFVAQTQVPKIMALAMLGQHERAIECAALTQRELVAHGDVRSAGKVSLNLGSLHFERDAYSEAASQYRLAAVLFARVADHEHSVMADIGLGDALTAMGAFDDALMMYARARMRAEAHGLPVLQALVEESGALLHLARGSYREALGGFERSRLRYEQLAMPRHVAIAEKQLADVYLELRLLPEALALYEQSIVRLAQLDAGGELALALTQQGRVLALLERPDDAQQSLQRAADLFRRNGATTGEAAVALVRSELALASGAAGQAQSLAAAAVAAFKQADMVERVACADVLRALAALALGQHEEAAASFNQGERRARALGLRTIRIQCLTGRGLARLARARGVAMARADFTAAVEMLEEQMLVLPGDDFQRAFLTGHLRPYQELLRLALDEHERRGHHAQAQAQEVLACLERYRARALGESMARPTRRGDDPDASLQRMRLNWLYRRVQRLQDEAAPVGGLFDEVRRAEADLLERARRQRLCGAVPQVPSAGLFDSRALSQALREDEALVEYGVLDEELFAAVITSDGVQVLRRVADWRQVRAALRSARFQLDSLRDGQPPVARHMEALAARAQLRLHAVRELVWEPLTPALSGVRRVLIVPFGALGSLPFGAFVGGAAPGEEIELAVVPSARVALHGLRAPRPQARSALVFGESSRLEHAADEALAVAALFPSARTFVGDAATLANLQAHAAGADVIHLACHAQFRADNPAFSALHLHDGLLTTEAAESLPLRQSIVVLSACETALADHGGGEEMVGLVRAFLVAGASRVVASLWQVDDRVTAGFMTRFYAALGRGMVPAAALREAQQATRREHPHPSLWAAFTLFGGW